MRVPSLVLPLLVLLPLLLSGCLGGCGPAYHGVYWDDAGFAGALAAADPEGWDVYAEPRPNGLAVEHPWLEQWNASLRSIGLSERVWVEDGEHHHGPEERELTVILDAPARLTVHVPSDVDPQSARRTALRLLETLTDGNESERRAWADDLFTARDPTEEDPSPERPVRFVPHRVDLPPERLRLQPFVDEHLDDAVAPADALRSGDWWLQVDYAQTIAVRGEQEFRASPERNQFRTGRTHDDEGPLLEEFRQAYASLGLGPAPEDLEYDASIC